MTDRDFDRMLSEQLAHQPVPESAVRRVTPWSTAIGYLSLGPHSHHAPSRLFVPAYLLPTVGFALLVLGLRSLRRENRMFFAGWVFSLAQAVWYLATLLLDVTGPAASHRRHRHWPHRHRRRPHPAPAGTPGPQTGLCQVWTDNAV